LFAVRDGTNELLGKRLFFKPDLGWMVKCPKREWSQRARTMSRRDAPR
jgi:hypothetical protein